MRKGIASQARLYLIWLRVQATSKESVTTKHIVECIMNFLYNKCWNADVV